MYIYISYIFASSSGYRCADQLKSYICSHVCIPMYIIFNTICIYICEIYRFASSSGSRCADRRPSPRHVQPSNRSVSYIRGNRSVISIRICNMYMFASSSGYKCADRGSNHRQVQTLYSYLYTILYIYYTYIYVYIYICKICMFAPFLRF